LAYSVYKIEVKRDLKTDNMNKWRFYMRRFTLPLFLVVLVLFSSQVCLGAKRVRGSGKLVTEKRRVKGITEVELATIGRLYIEVGDKEELIIEAEDNILQYLETYVTGDMLKIKMQRRVNLKPKKPVRYYLTVKKLEKIVISSAGDVEAPDLKADRFTIKSSSAGDLEMGDLDANSLDIHMSSAGDVNIGDVNAEKAEISVTSAGDLEMENVEVNSLDVRMSSAGDVSIWRLFAKTLELVNSSAGTMVIRGGEVDEQYISLSSVGSYKAENLESREATVRLSSLGSATINVQDYLDARISSTGSVYFVGNPTVRSRITSLGKLEKIGR
jgi:hypothetical protein